MLISVYTLFSLTACPAGRTKIGGTVYEYEPSPLQNRNSGGADTGGGAGVSGRMLEEYRTDITEIPEFTNYIEPLIQKIADKDLKMAADLTHIAVDRNWYILPTDLTKIPPSEMVASISKDRVQQIAIQTEAEVWIDQRSYGEFPTGGRVGLFVHELVMGVRMMQYQDDYDQCLAEAAISLVKKNKDEYAERRRKCAIKRLEHAGVGSGLVYRKRKLSNEDYDAVRNVTISLLNHLDSLSSEEVSAMRLIDLKRIN